MQNKGKSGAVIEEGETQEIKDSTSLMASVNASSCTAIFILELKGS